MIYMLHAIWHDTDGLTSVEYALLLALLVVAAIAQWTILGTRVQQTVTHSTAAFDRAGGGRGFGCAP